MFQLEIGPGSGPVRGILREGGKSGGKGGKLEKIDQFSQQTVPNSQNFLRRPLSGPPPPSPYTYSI